eukprot:2578571-Prymnesium_polylepis.1
MAPTSVGSPSPVPVPWASSIEGASSAAASYAASSNRICAVPLGAVRLARRPSERTLLPRKAMPTAPHVAEAHTETAPMPAIIQGGTGHSENRSLGERVLKRLCGQKHLASEQAGGPSPRT